ncbi:MAG: prolipoprotein diacylglyceryl transferase family protein [Actinomycetota bacterium]
MTYNDSPLGLRPNGSAFVRKSSAGTAGRPSDGSSPRIRRAEPRRGSRPIPGRVPLSAEALLTAAQEAPPLSPRPPRSPSTTPAVATPNTISHSRPPRLALRCGSKPVEMSSFTCQALAERDPQTLGVTYWFDAAPNGAPYTVRVHLSGRVREQPEPGQSETFTALATVDDVVPGSGRIAVTTRIPNLPHGTWDVTATPVEPAPQHSGADWVSVIDPRMPNGTAVGTTVFGPVVDVLAPGVRLGAWPVLVGTGTALALVIQGLLASRLGLPIPRLLALSLVTCLLGLLGAKTYYLATHRKERRTFLTPGMSIQGFVLVAVATLLGGSLLLGLSPGLVLDSTAPGLLLGMMVGRFGCLLGGCCAGRPTSSRWGVWSSDRRLGVRRIPVQLLESSLSGVVGAVALAAVLLVGTSAGGLVFVAGIAAYTAGRQLLFPLRGIPRTTAHGPMVMLGSASLVALAAVAALVMR